MVQLTPSLPHGFRGPVLKILPVAPKGCVSFESLSPPLSVILIISATAEERAGNLLVELSFAFSHDVDF